MEDLNNQAVELKSRGDFEGAERLYRLAMAQGDLKAAANLGILLGAQHRLSEAEDAFWVAIDGGFELAKADLATVFMEHGLLYLARENYQEIFLTSELAARNLTIIWAERKFFDRALGILDDFTSSTGSNELDNLRSQIVSDSENPVLNTKVLDRIEKLGNIEAQILKTEASLGTLSIEAQLELASVRLELATLIPSEKTSRGKAIRQQSIQTATPLPVSRTIGLIHPDTAALWWNAAHANVILLQLFAEQGVTGEPFVAWVDRLSRTFEEWLLLQPSVESLTDEHEGMVQNVGYYLVQIDDPRQDYYAYLLE